MLLFGFIFQHYGLCKIAQTAIIVACSHSWFCLECLEDVSHILTNGYKHLKLYIFLMQVALPRETVTGTCFLQHYIECVLALQGASCSLAQGLSSLSGV